MILVHEIKIMLLILKLQIIYQYVYWKVIGYRGTHFKIIIVI